jgi:DDE superfamily endonuclease
MPPLVILDVQSLPADAALRDTLARSEASVTATERGFMEDATFLSELRRICPLIGNGEQPAIMLLDGHGSRLQREAVRILAAHHIYCVIEPANSSMENQALDNGAMQAFNRAYRSLYTTELNLKRSVNSSRQLELALVAYEQAKVSQQFRTCWEGCVAEQRRSAGTQAAPEGRLTVREAWVQERTHHTSALPQHFSLATRFRDPSLPKVETQAQLKVSLPSFVYSLRPFVYSVPRSHVLRVYYVARQSSTSTTSCNHRVTRCACPPSKRRTATLRWLSS